MKKIFFIFALIFIIAGSSCKKDFLTSQAINPNAPSVAAPNLVLSGALKGAADVVNGTSSNYYLEYALWGGYLSYSTGYQTSVPYELYGFTTSSFNEWTPVYLNLSNFNALIQANAGPNYTAIAKIMMAYDFEELVDNYNDIPYSQALQGANSLNPVYDKGSAVYDDLLVQLDAAIKLIQGGTSAAAPSTADIMYGGNMTNWIKFANTLKLRIALRQSNIASKQAALATNIQATQSLGYIDATCSGEVNPGYTNLDANGGEQSPLWLEFGFSQSGTGEGGRNITQANLYAVNSFLKYNDTLRLKQVYAPNSIGKIVATAFGDRNPPSSTPSKLGPGVLKSATMNAKVLGAAESLFLQAEAAASGLITGNAATLYNAGITADFVDKGLTAAQAAAYYAQPSVAFPTGAGFAAQQKAIIQQKWFALDVYGAFEAFNELRRTGYPNDIPLSITAGANPPNQITRTFYPFVEYSTNATNVNAEGTINKFTSKIFWAK